VCADKEGCLGVVEDTWQWRSTFTILDTSCLAPWVKASRWAPQNKRKKAVEPTYLKNMLVKLKKIFPNFRGETKKIFEKKTPR